MGVANDLVARPQKAQQIRAKRAVVAVWPNFASRAAL
jgi:hypothetical protein